MPNTARRHSEKVRLKLGVSRPQDVGGRWARFPGRCWHGTVLVWKRKSDPHRVRPPRLPALRSSSRALQAWIVALHYGWPARTRVNVLPWVRN